MHGMIRSFLLLPGTVLIIIPATLLWLSRASSYAANLAAPNETRFWLGLVLLSLGLFLAIWTVRLQLTIGEGTPAPWDPPRKLVIKGPYRYVRNPMITGAVLLLAAESLLFNSWLIVLWTGLFLLLNLLYLPLVEEKDLEKRFGDSYRQFKAHVPRWIPRTKSWIGPANNNGEKI
jgi:protein-S-isoprenylcysteine O-methyltransferase Ste14